MKVLKFGGTSVGSADRLKAVVDIIDRESREARVVVVISAASGVTNRLVAALEEAERSMEAAALLLHDLYERHRRLAETILLPASVAPYLQVVTVELQRLRASFSQIYEEGTLPHLRDEVLAAGERLSAPLAAQALLDRTRPAIAVDAASLVRTSSQHGEASVDTRTTYTQIRSWFDSVPAGTIPVVTGYIGSDEEGRTTTLGRSGSDYSAALFASALRAVVLERWTDVDGIYDQDPRTSAEAEKYDYIKLEEAWGWNQAGKLGMHRRALDPLVEAGIPVHVRSTCEPDASGTLILPARYLTDRLPAVAG